MAIGTAGYTAMLSVLALERGGITPQRGDIFVTGANGGVGSIAIALLSELGHRVVASTGRMDGVLPPDTTSKQLNLMAHCRAADGPRRLP